MANSGRGRIMTVQRRIILGCGLMWMLLAGVYVPWQWTSPDTGHIIGSDGSAYGWLFAPPYCVLGGKTMQAYAHQVDWSRLLVEWLIISILTAGLAVLLPDPDRTRNAKHMGDTAAKNDTSHKGATR